MSIYKIRIFGDPVLREKALPVSIFDKEISVLAGEMREVMHDSDGVGLAANQIGVLKKIIIVSFEGEDMAFVNPKITWSSPDTRISEEGCLSLPGVSAAIERAGQVRVAALDLKGNHFEVEAEDILARIFQHEIDHTEGRVLFDNLEGEARKQALKELNDFLFRPDTKAK